MIPRFDARNFTGITPDMQECFVRDGVLVLDKLIPENECNALKDRVADMVDAFNPEDHKNVFSSVSEAHAQQEYFLNSGHQTCFFFEEDAFNDAGNLTKPKALALNKIGHAMHDPDETFNRFCRR